MSQWRGDDVSYSRKIGAFELCVWPGAEPKGPFQAWIRFVDGGTSDGLPSLERNISDVNEAKCKIEKAFRDFLQKHIDLEAETN